MKSFIVVLSQYCSSPVVQKIGPMTNKFFKRP